MEFLWLLLGYQVTGYKKYSIINPKPTHSILFKGGTYAMLNSVLFFLEFLTIIMGKELGGKCQRKSPRCSFPFVWMARRKPSLSGSSSV